LIRTNRLHIVPLSYEELVSRVYSFSGMITNVEEQENFIKYSLIPMKNAPERLHKWFTSWVAYFEGEEILECGFICPPTEHKVVEVFIYTKKEFQNKGFGTEAINGLVRLSTAYNNINHVCASIAKDNYASQRLFEKCGFKFLQDMNNGMKCYNNQIKN
jgi:ribosomal-protein-alanine N-acetyltransferase